MASTNGGYEAGKHFKGVRTTHDVTLGLPEWLPSVEGLNGGKPSDVGPYQCRRFFEDLENIQLKEKSVNFAQIVSFIPLNCNFRRSSVSTLPLNKLKCMLLYVFQHLYPDFIYRSHLIIAF